MRRLLLLTWLAVFVPSLVLVGCKGSGAEPAYPNDPLLISQRPVEGKPDASRPAALVRSEPRMPPMPSDALAAQPADPARGSSAEQQGSTREETHRVVRACLHPPGP